LEGNISEAITVLMVGMTTVFIILSLVVLSGNILIRSLNGLGFVLNEDDAKARKVASAGAGAMGSIGAAMAGQSIASDKQVAIEKALAQWSGGKANITKITKR